MTEVSDVFTNNGFDNARAKKAGMKIANDGFIVLGIHGEGIHLRKT